MLFIYGIIFIGMNLYTLYSSEFDMSFKSILSYIIFNPVFLLVFYLDWLGRGGNRIILTKDKILIDRRYNLFKKDLVFNIKEITNIKFKRIIGRSVMEISSTYRFDRIYYLSYFESVERFVENLNTTGIPAKHK